VVELDTDPEGKAIRAEMMEMIGRSSVPALWIKGEFCGGCNEGGPYGGITNMSESGKLDEMLKAVGAM
jgi:glutaredoxin-related protein